MAGVMRSALLWASQNPWLRDRVPRYRFVRRSVSRFMPGEELSDAICAARGLERNGLGTVFTRLGENITYACEAEAVTQHYFEVLERVPIEGLKTEVSVKLTQLGLDLSADLCFNNLERIVQRARDGSTVWIDMESSPYVDTTLDVYRRARRAWSNVGVCLQAYLYRTAQDLESLLSLGPAIRLVKGAYLEPPDRAFQRKKDVDENFFRLSQRLLSAEARKAGVRTAIATHDRKLIHRLEEWALSTGLGKEQFQFQMLYGIQRGDQVRLVKEGWRSGVLIAYGSYWYPWFIRRLAERPANVWFLARNLVAG
jgi:proline dehydrogenase